MAFTIDPLTGKIMFGVVSDGTHDAIARDIASEFGVAEQFNDSFSSFSPNYSEDFILPGPQINDSFGSDNYTSQDSPNIGVNLGTNRLEFDGVARGSTNQASTASYGGFQWGNSDIATTIRFKLEITAFTDTDSAQQSVFIGVSNLDSTNDSEALHDFLGVQFHASSGSPNGQLFTHTKNGATLKNSTGTLDPAMGASVRFIEIRRTSATSVTYSEYTDSTYETRISSVTEDCTGVQNIGFFGVWNLNDGFTSTNNIDGYIDDVQVWEAEGQNNELERKVIHDWVPTGLGFDFNLDSATQKIDVSVQQDGNTNIVTHDLLQNVSAVSEDQWTLRFKVRINTLIKDTSTAVTFAITDTEAGGGLGLAQDSISGVIDLHNSVTEGYGIGNTGHDNALLPIQAKIATKETVAIALSTNYFVELKRVSNTSATMQIFTDPQYLTPLAGVSQDVIPSAVQNLRYIKFFERELAGAGTLIYEVDDIEFFNGATQHQWVSTDKTATDIKGGVLTWNADRDTTNNTIAYDLGAGNVSDTEWLLRFKWLPINQTNPTGSDPDILYCTLSDSNQSVVSGTTQDHVLIAFQSETSPGVRNTLIEAGTGSLDSASDGAFTVGLWTAGTPVYVELKRTSATSYEASLFSDAKYENLIENIASASIDATVNNLRYIKFQNRSTLATDGVFDGSVDDLQFWNNTSTPVINSADWRLRFDLELTNIDDGASAVDKTLFFGLSESDGTVDSATTQDGFFLRAFTNTGPDAFHGITTNAEAPRLKSSDLTFSTAPSVTQFFIELRRLTGSTESITFYTDNTFSSVLESTGGTTISGTDNLRYLKAFNDNVANASGAIDGTIDNINYTDFEQVVVGAQQRTTQVDAILDAGLVTIDKEFIVNALIQSQKCGEEIVLFDQIGGNSGLWTSNSAQIVIDSGSSGVVEMNSLAGGGTTTSRRATRALDTSFQADIGIITIRQKVTKISGTDETAIFMAIQNGTGDASLVGASPRLLHAYDVAGGLFATLSDGTNQVQASTPPILLGDAETQFVETIYDPVAKTLTLNSYSDSSFTTHVTGSPIISDASIISMPVTIIDTVVSSNFTNSGAGKIITADLDDYRVITGGCPSTQVNALLQSQGANGACPSGAEVVSSVLDNIDDWDTQVNTGSTNFKIGQRWTPTVGEVALLENGITKVNLWHGHTGGSGSFDTFVWDSASVGTSSENVIRFGGTFNFIGSSSSISKRNRTLFDATGSFVEKWLPTAGVEYVIGIVEDFPGTAQTRKTSTDTNNGVFTTRSSAGNWTDTVGQDWTLQFTIEQSGLGQGDQNFCIGADGILVAPTIVDKEFTVNALLQVTCGERIIFQDDFTTNANWTQVNTGVSVTGGEIQGWGADATDRRVYHDLVTPLDDKGWKAEFEFEFSAFSGPTFGPAHDIFIMSDTQAPATTLQDYIGIRFGISELNRFALLAEANSQINTGVGVNTTDASINTRYFVRLERISPAQVKMSIFTGGFDVTPFGNTVSGAISTAITGLRFVSSSTNTIGGSARTLTGIIDNLDITNVCCSFEVDAFIQAKGENGGCDTVILGVPFGSRSEQDSTFSPGVGGGTSWGEGAGIRFTPDVTMKIRAIEWNSTKGGGFQSGQVRCQVYTGVPTSGNITAGSVTLLAGQQSFNTDDPHGGNEGSLSQFITFWATGSQKRRNEFLNVPASTNTSGIGGFLELDAGTEYVFMLREQDVGTGWSVSSTTGGNSNQSALDVSGVRFEHWNNVVNPSTAEVLDLSPDDFAVDFEIETNKTAGCAEVNALLQSQGVCSESTIVFDQIGGNSGLWTEVDGAGEIEIDLAGSGVLEWNSLRGGGLTVETFAHRTIPNFADNVGKITLRIKVDKISSNIPTGRFIVIQNNNLHPNPSTGSSFQIALSSSDPSGGIFASLTDGTNSVSTTPRPAFPNSIKYLEAIYDPVGQTLTQNIYTDANFSIHDTGSPVQVDASAVSMTGLTFTHMLTSNVKNSGTSRVISADLDDFTVITGGCPSISVDAILDQQIQTIDKEFQVHARLAVRKEFIVDAIVRYAQGTSLLGGIPDLIIRVLRENPPSLTGLEIVDEIVEITSDPAEGFSFRGKTSRIKNWLNRLRLDNLILNDNSNPDWYRTNWSLNPAVFP